LNLQVRFNDIEFFYVVAKQVSMKLPPNTYLIEKNDDTIVYTDISEWMHLDKRLSRAFSWKPFSDEILSDIDDGAGFVVRSQFIWYI